MSGNTCQKCLQIKEDESQDHTECNNCAAILKYIPERLRQNFEFSLPIFFMDKSYGVQEGNILALTTGTPPSLRIRYVDSQWRDERYDRYLPVEKVFESQENCISSEPRRRERPVMYKPPEPVETRSVAPLRASASSESTSPIEPRAPSMSQLAVKRSVSSEDGEEDQDKKKKKSNGGTRNGNGAAVSGASNGHTNLRRPLTGRAGQETACSGPQKVSEHYRQQILARSVLRLFIFL
jgi:hypothetical protein